MKFQGSGNPDPGCATLPSFQVREVLACEQEPDGSSLPRHPLNEADGFKVEDHLVHGRGADMKVSLHVGLGRRTAVELAVVIKECKILTLFVGEGFCRHEGSVP